VCLQAKPGRALYPRNLQPLPTHEASQTVSLDFIEGLSKFGNYCILVVVDKFDHFIPLSHPYTASLVAMVFLNEI
jgi:hypothetical protein